MTEIEKSFLEAIQNSKDIEFGFINDKDETFIHKHGKWTKYKKKFKFLTNYDEGAIYHIEK